MIQQAVVVEAPVRRDLQLGGVLARAGAWVLLVAAVLGIAGTGPNVTGYAITAAIYVLVGLSLNVVLGYVGQLSLGQQALVGTGALFAAYLSKAQGWPFPVDVAVGGLAGAVLALLIGFVALRIRGLYLALVTLVIGITLQGSLFEVPALTGGGAGESANRPSFLLSNGRYYLVCVAVCAAVFYIDTRLERSKVGRALVAIKTDERVAFSFGVDVMSYKLLAFVLSGFIAGVAGGLFAFATQQFNGNDFSFQLALTFVLMTVVGGTGSRVGVAVGSVIFALLHTVVATSGPFVAFANLFPASVTPNVLQFGPDLIGAFLLLLTLAFNPSGLAQQLAPVTRWMGGGPLRLGAGRAGRRFPEGAAHVAP
ncbi:MAG: branched-chain amino acid ABC transporter permease [Acidimicrobiales bacterium]